jgi:hypothetical protein
LPEGVEVCAFSDSGPLCGGISFLPVTVKRNIDLVQEGILFPYYFWSWKTPTSIKKY